MTAPPTRPERVIARTFRQRLSPTPRGARLARHLALNQLQEWGIPHDTSVSDAIAVIVAELAANAVTHGRVPGRDFELALSLVAGSVRVEVTDTRADAVIDVRKPRPLEEAGRGLVLVDALADRWEVVDRQPPPGKTVRAEVDVPGWLGLVRDLDGEV
ncbi:anti-sigma regulatory factor (Ser/Thr protein kinase) [Streptomyces sp. TLI_55]|uniref:ATP-binding protein n=1 Tax=Streptomyces sp. TLI_55 TaxID=1938861 RepID=UPI000BC4CB08|nr:ATP-binding protein [Streptomyces sp. TLI_55]SNX58206.1 anti-sigma regulatory factor (Ser/Thr protein kinase) [Streptomyces sp. TLI_55]